MALPLFRAVSRAAQPLVDILNAGQEALGNLPPMPHPGLFDSAAVRAEKRARAAEIRRQREAIEADTIAKIRALAEQGLPRARGDRPYKQHENVELETSPPRTRGSTLPEHRL